MDIKKIARMVAIASGTFLAAATQPALATIVYESLPSANSTQVSRHGVQGPVLADDFKPAASGWVTQVDWWGGAPISGGTDWWEITFHADNAGQPAATPPLGGLAQHVVSASGADPDGDGIYFYSAAWNPTDIFVDKNFTYWFSVANATGATWTWAIGQPPSVGSEQYLADVSTGIGPNGGPHFGPWKATTPETQDFAFRVHVPEPATLALMGLGLAGIGFARRGKRV